MIINRVKIIFHPESDRFKKFQASSSQLVMGVLFCEKNGSARFNFDFGGDDFGGFGGSDGGSSSYDYNGGRMPRSRALRSLNLGSGASLRDIKSSYRNLAKLYHPDKCGRGDDGMSAKMCEKKFIQVSFGRIYQIIEFL